MEFRLRQTLSHPMARHDNRHQATGERQIAVAPLGLISVLIVSHPGSGPALQFPSAVDVMKEP